MYTSWPFRAARAARAWVAEFLTPTLRRWVYGVFLTLVPLGLLLGWWSAPTAALLAPLALALLMVEHSPADDRADEAVDARHALPDDQDTAAP